MNFAHFQNSCARNGDHLILLIKTGNTHKKEYCHTLSIINTQKCEGGRDRNIVVKDDGGQMAVAFTLTEINYLVVILFAIWYGPFPINTLWYIVLWPRYLPCFRHSNKSSYSLPKFILFLFAIFILHSRESELYRCILDGKSALAWELLFLRCLGHLPST